MRRQLPVHSPVTLEAILAGLGAAIRGDGGGTVARRLEELLAARYGARDVLLTDSGTAALRLAIGGAMGQTNGVVALPGYGCYDLATAAIGAGVKVVLYDLDPITLGPDMTSLTESLASAEPHAVVVAHLFGYPVGMDAVGSAARDALVIEDAAQAAGGRLGGRLLGGIGSVSILSFGRGKGMTGGGGGALLARDERGASVLERARREIQVASGRGTAKVAAMLGQLVLGRPSVYGIPASLPFLHLGETIYQTPRAPRGATVASMAMLERLVGPSSREVEVRTRNASRLGRAVADSPRVRPVEIERGGEPGYLRLPVVLRSGRRVEDDPRLGITHMYPQTLGSLPALGPHLIDRGRPLPGSSALVERLLTLPTHSFLAERDLRLLEAWLSES